MNEHRWAQLGKALAILGALGAITTIILGGFQIIDRLKSPTVSGAVEIRNRYIDPKLREVFEQRIERKLVLDAISYRQKNGQPANKIVDAIKEMASSKDELSKSVLEMEFTVAQFMMVFQVKNDASSVAREVKIILPGEGQAEIVEASNKINFLSAKRVQWSDQIPLGDIRPKGKIEVRVWPKVMVFANFSSVNPAIMHAGGTGKIREVHGFYGWDADLVAWFLVRSDIFKLVFAAILISGAFAIFWYALRRGFIVLKPKKQS